MFKNNKIMILLLIILLSHSIVIFSQEPLDFMELVTENKYLALYLNPKTTEIAVQDKRSDFIWHSNPPYRQEEEKIAHGSARDILGSQLAIVFDRGQDSLNRDNYQTSIKLEQFKIREIDNGVRIDYTIGKAWDDEDYIPAVISKEDMEEQIINKLNNPGDQEFILDQYNLIQLVKVKEEDELIEFPGLDRDKLFGEYRLELLNEDYQRNLQENNNLNLELAELKEQLKDKGDLTEEEIKEIEGKINDLERRIRTLDRNLNRTLTNFVSDFVRVISAQKVDVGDMLELEFDDISDLINTPTYVRNRTIPVFNQRDMVSLLKEINFSPENVILTHSKYRLDPPQPNIEVFKVPLIYTLEKDNLVVKIPVQEVVYPKNVYDLAGNKHTRPLRQIRVLEYFGAASLERSGYIFVPDGSGALIELNKERVGDVFTYQAPVYGRDNSLDPLTAKSSYGEQIYLPVYGMKVEDKAFLAIIEKGDALANIRVDLAGLSNSYNTIYPEFNVIARGRTGLGGVGYINIYQSEMYQGDIQIRYAFLNEADANYAGMARYYQDYLVDNYNLEKNNSKQDMPFFLDIVGGITEIKPVLGIPREVMTSLTTFSEAKEIIELLLENEVNNIKLRYKGWLEGGLEHRFPSQLNIANVLGGEKEFSKLTRFLADNNIDLYPELSLLNVYRNDMFDGFKPKEQAARYMNRQEAIIRGFDLASRQAKENGYYVLSPSYLPSLVEEVLDNYQKYNLNTISFTYLGEQINSDFRENPNELVNRQDSKKILQEQLAKIRDKDIKIMLNGANGFVIPYLESINNIPLTSSNLDIFDRSVPFIQMILSGFIDYAGEPLNLSQADQNFLKLKMLETGVSPSYKWSFSESFSIKNTNYQHLFALNYQDFLEEALDFYQEANALWQKTQGEQIVDHKKIAENIYQTSYKNGVKVIVNYNKDNFNYKGTMIAGESYLVIRGDEK